MDGFHPPVILTLFVRVIRLFAPLMALASLACGRGTVRILPPGVTEVSSEIRIPAGTEDYEVRGDARGSSLRMSDQFNGRALFVCEDGRRIRFRSFSIDGNRDRLEQRAGLPPSDVPFSRFIRNNGILAKTSNTWKFQI